MDILSEIKNIDKLIKTKLDRITRLRELATRTTPCYEVERVQTQSNDKMAAIVAKITSIENEVIQELNRLLDLQLMAEDTINSINNNNHKIILTDYYLNNKTMEEIAEEMQYDDRHIYKIREKAIEEFKHAMKCH